MRLLIVSILFCLTSTYSFSNTADDVSQKKGDIDDCSSLNFTEKTSYKDYPAYRLIDLGTLETDRSEAIAINEKGQVLGTFEDKLATFIFLWDPEKGLKVLDRPFYRYKESVDDLKLNNKGDVVGVLSQEGESSLLRWYTNYNFLEISSPPFDNLYGLMFNDKGHVVFNNRYFYDKSKTYDLKELFYKTVSEDFVSLGVRSLDKFGNVTVVIQKKSYNSLGELFYAHRSFLWDGVVFKELAPNEELDVCHRDDAGNLIVRTVEKGFGSWLHFVRASDGATIRLPDHYGGGDFILRGNSLIRVGSLPGEIKYDLSGNLYYGPGVYIEKLLIEEAPFYNVSGGRTHIRDQNSKGYVVGDIDTLYPGCHAFLAVPEKKKP